MAGPVQPRDRRDPHLSVKTVETHVEHILDKLGIEPSPGEHRRVLAVLELLRAGD